MNLKKYKLAILLSAISVLALPTYAQLTSGNIAGTVYDQTGATVPGATVTAKNIATGAENNTVTTGSGEYRISNLLAGKYDLTIDASGFTKKTLNNVAVELSQTVTANINLEVGKSSTTVEVSTAAASIDTTTAQVQTTFESKQMTDLPSASTGSGVINLSLLSAGVSSSGGIGQGTGPSIGGQRPTNNNFTIEGIDNNNKSVTGPLVTVPNDAVAEFSVLANQFSPDFGHSSGGQFNQVIKSGTNSFHGALYEYFENRNLNAADNLNAVEGNPLHPRYDNNRFGGNVGGPIKRNKMFFFVDYEYNPVGSTAGTYYYAPTSAGYSMLSGLPGINQTNLGQLEKYFPGKSGATMATASVAPSLYASDGSVNSQAYQTGIFSSGTAGALQIPLTMTSSSLPSYTNNEAGVAAFDYNISDKDSLRSRFVLNRTGEIDANGFPQVFFTTTPFNYYLITASEYHTFAPNVTNELRLGYNRYFNVTNVPNISYPGLDQFPNIDIYEMNLSLGPDGNAPQGTIQNTYQLADNLSWSHGKHNFKFGFDGWKSISPQDFLQRSRGDYEYNYLNDFLYDVVPDQIAERSVGTAFYSGDQFLLGFYGNDDWKILPNLTINIGLRYEYQTVPYSERLQSVNSLASVPGLISFNEPQPQKVNFMPRVGFAYSPGTSGKTSIRGGFGRNYDVLYDNLGILSFPPEFNSTVDSTAGPYPGYLANGGISPYHAPITTAAEATAATSGYIPNQKRPEALQWNFGIQHVFANDYTFETRYLGSRGINLPVQQRINDQPVVNSSNALPVYFSTPSQATLNSLASNLTTLSNTFDNGGYLVPSYLNAGFQNFITAFMPVGNSTYHGWANQLTRRFSNGLQFMGSYTWSHNIDDSTASTFSTLLTPRRAQDAQDLKPERASSGLDARQRLTFETLYDVPFFKHSNWFLKNVLGNWEVAPVYTYQTGTLVTPQSATDSNLNGDSWGDRVVLNSNGVAGTGSGVTALTNSAGDIVAYQAINPNAMYIQAAQGVLATSGRNIMHLNPINDLDVSAAKRINFTETTAMEFSVRALNVLNHSQYTGGYLNDVAPIGYTGTLQRNFLNPSTSVFDQPDQVFSSNPRTLQLSLKFIF